MKQEYPNIHHTSLEDVINKISMLREDDIREFRDLRDHFIQGRKVQRIPRSSIDIQRGDCIGDFSYNANFMYLLTILDKDSGAAWRRVKLENFDEVEE